MSLKLALMAFGNSTRTEPYRLLENRGNPNEIHTTNFPTSSKPIA